MELVRSELVIFMCTFASKVNIKLTSMAREVRYLLNILYDKKNIVKFVCSNITEEDNVTNEYFPLKKGHIGLAFSQLK